jgi:S-ribosylhomocysteine lyase
MNIKNSVTFNVDHSKLTRGVYFSKKDVLSDVSTITLDIRMRVPYKEEVISNEEMHTFEHCFATAVRDVAEKYENMAISYFGPMGCQTGYYLVVNFTGVDDKDYFPMLLKLLEDSCNYIENMTEVPAKNELQCGNCYTLGDMDLAKKAERDLKVLVEEMKANNSFHKYTYM